jgi:hypothetical protein
MLFLYLVRFSIIRFLPLHGQSEFWVTRTFTLLSWQLETWMLVSGDFWYSHKRQVTCGCYLLQQEKSFPHLWCISYSFGERYLHHYLNDWVSFCLVGLCGSIILFDVGGSRIWETLVIVITRIKMGVPPKTSSHSPSFDCYNYAMMHIDKKCYTPHLFTEVKIEVWNM